MGLLASSLITVAQLKAYLLASGLVAAEVQHDALFEILIDGVSAAFDGAVGRALAKTTYTAVYFDGNGKADLVLPNYPIISISSIEEDGDALAEGEDYDYQLYASSGILKRTTGAWLKGSKTIKLTYIAGYTVQGGTLGTGEIALPADLKLACMIQVAREWKKAQGAEWGETSRSFNDGSRSFVEKGLLKEVEDVLARYRRDLL